MNKIICAWCSTTMRDGIEPISHGCCADCGPKVVDQVEANADERIVSSILARRLKLSLKVIASAQALAWQATSHDQKRKFLAQAEQAVGQ